MSDNRTFFVREIRVLTSDSTGLDHDGNEMTNAQFPRGTILAIDMDGLVFSGDNRPHGDVDPEADLLPGCWPRRTKMGIPLYRDYWTYVYDSKDLSMTSDTGAPYFRAIANASFKTIKAMITA